MSAPTKVTPAPNPDWTHDELVLALDLYFRTPPERIADRNPDIIELSEILRRLPIHPPESRSQSFRSPKSVKSKLANFLNDEYPTRSLSHGSKLDGQVLREFFSRRVELHELAEAIKNGAAILLEDIPDDSPDDDEGAAEGGILYRLHRRRERSRGLAEKKKRSVFRRLGKLECEFCAFDFEARFGERGKGLIECHHVKPLSAVDRPARTRLVDLAIICPNCHRMIHRIRPLPSPDEFRRIISPSFTTTAENLT